MKEHLTEALVFTLTAFITINIFLAYYLKVYVNKFKQVKKEAKEIIEGNAYIKSQIDKLNGFYNEFLGKSLEINRISDEKFLDLCHEAYQNTALSCLIESVINQSLTKWFEEENNDKDLCNRRIGYVEGLRVLQKTISHREMQYQEQVDKENGERE